jgi:GNAT superfamily N-acetyltransferase
MGTSVGLDLRSAAAANLAGWHAVSLRALGIPEERTRDAWRALGPAPGLYFRWIGLRRPLDAHERAAQERSVVEACRVDAPYGSACDPWRVLDLAPLGLVPGDDQPWMLRPVAAAQLEAPILPSELEILRVVDADGLAAFEQTAAAGFEAAPVERFAWHAPGILADDRLAVWLGLVDGLPVSVAMSFAEAGVLGIYGVATIPEARRRGYGAALTWHALASAPRLPAVLQPSAMAEGLYRRLGFERFATFGTWQRPPAGELP